MPMDSGQLLAATQSPLAGQQTRLLGILGDVQFQPMLPLKAFNIESKICAIGGRPRQPSGLFASLGLNSDAIMEGFRKCAQAGPVMQSSPTDVYGHGLGAIGRGGSMELA